MGDVALQLVPLLQMQIPLLVFIMFAVECDHALAGQLIASDAREQTVLGGRKIAVVDVFQKLAVGRRELGASLQ